MENYILVSAGLAIFAVGLYLAWKKRELKRLAWNKDEFTKCKKRVKRNALLKIVIYFFVFLIINSIINPIIAWNEYPIYAELALLLTIENLNIRSYSTDKYSVDFTDKYSVNFYAYILLCILCVGLGISLMIL